MWYQRKRLRITPEDSHPVVLRPRLLSDFLGRPRRRGGSGTAGSSA
jgi:hypothetical protein